MPVAYLQGRFRLDRGGPDTMIAASRIGGEIGSAYGNLFKP